MTNGFNKITPRGNPYQFIAKEERVQKPVPDFNVRRRTTTDAIEYVVAVRTETVEETRALRAYLESRLAVTHAAAACRVRVTGRDLAA